jgi:hypothetical protein
MTSGSTSGSLRTRYGRYSSSKIPSKATLNIRSDVKERSEILLLVQDHMSEKDSAGRGYLLPAQIQEVQGFSSTCTHSLGMDRS